MRSGKSASVIAYLLHGRIASDIIESSCYPLKHYRPYASSTGTAMLDDRQPEDTITCDATANLQPIPGRCTQLASNKTYQGPDPHAYTKGRWLRHDSLQRQSRYITFDFDLLRRKVLDLCPNAVAISSCEKYEGGFNRVFIFTCDNGVRVTARLPTSVAGPPRLVTNSEVATIKYLQSNTSVPIPTILDWNDDPSNPVGSEYIIMEPAKGVSLHYKWPTMTGPQQVRCVGAVAQNIRQVANIVVPAYGSLYFADVSIESSLKHPFVHGYCIGPNCGVKYWDCNVGESRYYENIKPNRGAWPQLAAYCDGLIDTGLSRLPPPHIEAKLPERLPYYGSVAAHRQLLQYGRDVLYKLSEDSRIQETAAPSLYHPDLHKRNIFVSENDPTVVTDIIDWQSTSAEPGFMYADHVPDFATLPASSLSEGKLGKTDADLCARTFEIGLLALAPVIGEARRMDETLLRPFRYCHRTWRDGSAAFRQDLIEIARRWEDLGLPAPCPYPMPGPEELQTQQKHYKLFEIAQNLKRDLIDILEVQSDGLVHMDRWEAVCAFHKETFDEIMRSVKEVEGTDDGDITADEVKKMWPFDHP